MDSFIHKLTEEFAIKLADYTVFDIANSSDGLYYTNKVSYETLLNQLSGDIFRRLKALLDGLQSNLNVTNANIARKLDKQGTNFSPNEKMSGPLVLNSTLCATGISYFTNLVTVNNNFISNVRDPVLDQDAVNLRTLSAAINTLNIPRGSDYIKRSGDTMTGGFITAASDFPTADRHLATKIYVDQEFGRVNTRINGFDFVRRSGDTMTGALFLPLSSPTQPSEATNKDYVDRQISSIEIPSTVGLVRRSGDTMTGTLMLTGNPRFDDEASNKRYVDFRIQSLAAGLATVIYVDSTFVKKSGDTMLGSLVLKGFSEIVGTSSSSGNVNLNLNLGNTFPITLGGNVTGFTLSNIPTDSFSIVILVTQAATGGPFTASFTFTGFTVKWANGSLPAITTTPDKTDILCFTRVGNTIYGFNGGQNF